MPADDPGEQPGPGLATASHPTNSSVHPKLPPRARVTGTVPRVSTPFRQPSRALASAGVLAACLLPLGGAFAFADTPLGPPDATTPATGTTPTTPTPSPTPSPTPAPTTPVPTTPTLAGPASIADIAWTAPGAIVEEAKLSLKLEGTLNGQATAHVAMLPAEGGSCPTSPLYPMQTATGTRVVVKPAAGPAPTTPTPARGTTTHTLTLTPKEAGTFWLCGWLVGTPAANETSTVSRFSQLVGVANRAATLAADIPSAARSADYFTVKLAGSTPASGRRVLIMAEPDRGQRCDTLRKAPSGRRPLQAVVGLPSGAFEKTLRLRYRSKTAGAHLLCAQIVETNDRTPEAVAQRSMVVGETLKCVNTQVAVKQRAGDLGVIRSRRDAALTRLRAAKEKLAPLRAKVRAQRAASGRRIDSAKKAVRRAKSAKGRERAKARLARVKRAEARRIYAASGPLRSANAAVRQHDRAYRQYKTGARLLDETITRTRKDLKKYCAAP